MIKIRWIEKKRKFVPRVGFLEYDKEVIVPEEIGKALIKQGQAELVIKKKSKVKEKD